MNRLFPLPIFTFLSLVIKNGGISLRKLKNTPPWILKTIVFEPVRWLELAIFNQRISCHKLEKDPLFILGFYRSGTSYLHECFTQDDRLGYHNNYQMVLPEVMLSTEKVLLPFFQFICRIFNLKDSVHRVPLSFRFPGEEDATMTTFLDPKGAQWGYFFPKMMEEQFQKYVMFENLTDWELQDWKESFSYLINKISIANKGKQLVLKSPPNTARIKLLLNLYPKAKFIFIHRNPYQVYASNKRFWEVVQKVFALQGTKGVNVNEIILETYSKMMQKYLAEKEFVPKGQLTELAYDNFIQDPVKSLKNAYEELNLGHFAYCEEKMKSFTAKKKQFVQLKHSLPEKERILVDEYLEPIFKHWNYAQL
ncbi:sulfotransferase family protein [Shivajiella indica]|uniref:Sulfotransferase family protein n=1 Tax=Shivajiella indica TaxID=872115 RepID=A0ABW5B6K6_9BACT